MTRLGKVAASLYFHAEDVNAWAENFTKLFEEGMENTEMGAAWALGNIPVSRGIGDFSDRWEVVSECKGMIPSGFDVMEGSVINVVLWWCVMGGASAGKLKHKVFTMRGDFGRIRRALCELDDAVGRWGKHDYFDGLAKRVGRGVPMSIFRLYSLGVSKGLAQYLYNMGVKDKVSLKENIDSLCDVDEVNMKLLREIVESV